MPGRPGALIAAAIWLPAALLFSGPGAGNDRDTAEADARAWLERMNRAVRELDYEGYFVYSHGATLDAMHIVHVNREGRERERLISLNGAARQVLRDDKAVTCLLPSKDKIHVSRRPIGRSLSPLLPIASDKLTENYRFSLGPEQRIAGRRSVTVDIQPKDDLRYGHLMSLDREHALPLRSVMRDAAGGVLSQILFTHLRVGDEVSDVALAKLPEEITDHPRVSDGLRDLMRLQSMQKPCCRFATLPTGFELTMHRHRAIDKQHRAEHFVFSDGLSSVSVYVESNRPGQGLNGAANQGSVNMLGLHLEPYQVTLVGEVPVATLQQFAQNMSVSSP